MNTIEQTKWQYSCVPMHVGVVLGTRPEAIKCAPVIQVLREAGQDFRVTVISTGQHREMLQQALSSFDLVPDVNLDLMLTASDLTHLMSRAIQDLAEYMRLDKPHILLVQGDTSTAFAGALAAFYQGIPVGHIEAGLRSGDRYNPFPEEVNRCAISLLADLHFAPTSAARDALLGERIPESSVLLTGNTAVDSLQQLTQCNLQPVDAIVKTPVNGRRLVLVTAHRREAWGAGLEEICHSVLQLAQRYPDVLFVFPVHKNPVVRNEVQAVLGRERSVCLLDSLEYRDLISVLRASFLVLTDSGGIQEEAPTFRVPVLVMRHVTERMEAVHAGLARLVGTTNNTIVREVSRLLDDPQAYALMRKGQNPFGDGLASQRIAQILRNWRKHRLPLLDPNQAFMPSI